MAAIARYFSVRGLAQDDRAEGFDHLVQRWQTMRAQREAVLRAIRAGEELPPDLPVIECTTLNTPITLVDLRGIDLSGEEIGALDLSYCCFDFAKFDGTSFTGTHFQFSSFAFASLENSRWVEVQASPISAPRAKLSGATFTRTFLMRSDLEGADLTASHLDHVRLIEANLRHASLEAASFTEAVDVSGTMVDDALAEAIANLQSVKGQPAVSEASASEAPIDHFDMDLLVDLELMSDDTSHEFALAGPRLTWEHAQWSAGRTKPRILVVDDSLTALHQSQRALSAGDFEVYIVDSGGAAIEQAHALQPDLVILDIEMPQMNGLEVARRLRHDAVTYDVPILMMSAQVGKYAYQVLNAGVQGFVSKPFKQEELIDRVERLTLGT